MPLSNYDKFFGGAKGAAAKAYAAMVEEYGDEEADARFYAKINALKKKIHEADETVEGDADEDAVGEGEDEDDEADDHVDDPDADPLEGPPDADDEDEDESLEEAGTSEGAKKGWDTRGRGRKEQPDPARSARSKQAYITKQTNLDKEEREWMGSRFGDPGDELFGGERGSANAYYQELVKEHGKAKAEAIFGAEIAKRRDEADPKERQALAIKKNEAFKELQREREKRAEERRAGKLAKHPPLPKAAFDKSGKIKPAWRGQLNREAITITTGSDAHFIQGDLIQEDGTSEGAKKGWDTRGRGRKGDDPFGPMSDKDAAAIAAKLRAGDKGSSERSRARNAIHAELGYRPTKNQVDAAVASGAGRRQLSQKDKVVQNLRIAFGYPPSKNQIKLANNLTARLGRVPKPREIVKAFRRAADSETFSDGSKAPRWPRSAMGESSESIEFALAEGHELSLIEARPAGPIRQNQLNRAMNVIEGTVLITANSTNGGKGGRRYSDDALKQIAAMAEGMPAYLNHVAPDLAFKPRDVKDLIGVHRNVRYFPVEGRILSDLHVAPHHAPLVFGLAETLGGHIGNSLVSRGLVQMEGETEVVKEMLTVRSADIVSDPATTKGLFESRGSGDDPDPLATIITELRESIKTAALKEEHMDLAAILTFVKENPDQKGVLAEALGFVPKPEAGKLQEQVTTLAGERDALTAELAEAKVALGTHKAKDALAEKRAKLVTTIEGHDLGKQFGKVKDAVSDEFKLLLEEVDEARWPKLLDNHFKSLKSVPSGVFPVSGVKPETIMQEQRDGEITQDIYDRLARAV